ncbi:MAG TPA: YppG family protein [Bacillota bacterium]|nr:YppG family protein [Bacillota bacterium]
MFPLGPRPPFPPRPPHGMFPYGMKHGPPGMFPQGPMPGASQGQQKTNMANLLSMFKTDEGQFDLEKISTTMKHVNDIYGQVRPMLSKFFNK